MFSKRSAVTLLGSLVVLTLLLAHGLPVRAAASDLFFSEYVEGGSLNKAVEIYNGTGGSVNLAGYSLEFYFNGSGSAGVTIALSGTVADGDVWVVADDGADAAVLAQADQTPTSNFFSGNDAVVLKNGTTVIDSIGVVGSDPGTEWGTGLTSTADNTLRRKATICAGDTNTADAFEPSVEWDGFTQNTFDGLGFHAADCGPVEPAGPAEILLTEIVVTPTEGEFIEIYNPGGQPVDLSDYYLTDATFAGGNQYYYNIVTGSGAGGGGFGDFHARFPDGATIGAGQYQTLALAGSDDFFTTYGVAPDYELYDDTVDNGEAQMREAITGSINSQGGLTNDGEVVVLYYWDGATDLVTDMDYVLWGDKVEAVDKTGITIDGPDADSDTSTYLNDTAISSQDVVAPGQPHAFGNSGQRDDLSEGTEMTSGGNGVNGEDETSENLSATWCEAAPTPGTATECPILVADVVINELDANTPSTDTLEFVELYDGGAGNTALDGLVVVFYNGNGDTSYAAFDLDGRTTDANGYFLLGNAGVSPTPAITFANDTLQNGADAVAIYAGDGADFPNGTAVTTTGLVDAIVYDTNDSDDAALLVLLNAGQPQVNEAANGNDDTESNQRCPNGEGGARNTDTYTQAAPTPGAANTCAPPPPTLTCDTYPNTATVVMVHDIQGSGATTPIPGAEVGFEGIVVGDFQNNGSPDNGHLNGFYVQEEDADADGDPATSEGIFVFSADTDVAVGDKVRVVGTATEYVTSGGASSMTQIASPTVVVCGSGQTLPTTTQITLPVTDLTDFERYEGMLVTFPQNLVISEYFNFDRFGEIVLATERQFQATAQIPPGPAAAALAAQQELARIMVDDGRSFQNPDPAIHPDGNVFDLTNRFRGGDLVQDVTGVIDDTFGRYRVQPVQGATYTAVNDRELSPADVGGNLTIASFNVLNYFNGDGQGGGFPTPRGADDANEFDRQRTKIIAALTDIDADVVGLMEIENDGYGPFSAIQDLVDGLNDATSPGTYAFVDPGVAQIGTDEIAVGLIYKPASVSLLGTTEILDSSDDFRFNDDKNRPVLAQTFLDSGTGGIVTVAVNHLKSKGSACDDVGDPDTGDGAGNCNITRLLAAEALVDWLATDPTGAGNGNSLIIGDLNSYDKEDPITAILAGPDDTAGTGDDYTDLIAQFNGEFAYGYVFDGRFGYLDYALANESLLPFVTGVTEWHINADEPDILDYDTSFKQPAQQALFEPNAFRSSDHDPVIVGLDLTPPTVGEICPVDPNVGFEQTDILGTGMGSEQRSQRVSKVRVWYADDVVDLYGQMAAKAFGGVRWVRFQYSDNSFEQVNTATDLGVDGAISWWGADLDESTLAFRPFVKGRWFLEKGSKKVKVPRAFVVYPTYATNDAYANVWSTFSAPGNYVDSTPGFSQTMTNTLTLPTTQGTADLVVRLALADIDSTPSSVDVTVSAGGVEATKTISKPINKKMESLNIVEFTLNNVPAGTSEVEIVVETALGSGDSAALLGAAAHYACSP